MKKTKFMTLLSMAMVAVLLIGCDTAKYDPNKPSENKELTPEESKQKLANVANEFVNTFNPEDQREAVDAVNEVTTKFTSFNTDAILEYFGDDAQALTQLPRYAAEVAQGRRVATDVEPFVISLEKYSVIFEADEATQTWVNKGKAPDNSIILRVTTKEGKKIETKLWGKGKNSSYDFNEEDVNVTVILPKNVYFTLVLDQTELIRVELEQDVKLSDHFIVSVLANVANLSWTADVKLTLSSASLASSFKYGQETIYSIGVNVPKCKLIGKEDNQTYEDWLMQYGRRYEELIQQIGSADAVVNVLGEVQAKVKFKNVGKFYTDLKDFAESHQMESKEDYDAFCKLINEAQENGIYYNNNIKQAELRWQTYAREYETGSVYYPEAVIYFPADGTTYSIEEYFSGQPFTDMLESFYALVNKYAEYFGEILGGGNEPVVAED